MRAHVSDQQRGPPARGRGEEAVAESRVARTVTGYEPVSAASRACRPVGMAVSRPTDVERAPSRGLPADSMREKVTHKLLTNLPTNFSLS